MFALPYCALCLFLTVPSRQPDKFSPRAFEATRETSADPDRIWRIWTDVAGWKNWDSGLRDASLAGAFVAGAKGKIVALNGRTASFRVTEVEAGVSYTYRVKLPLAALELRRRLEQTGGRTIFTHQVRFVGLLGGVFARVLGKRFRELLPEVMENVKALAENP